MSRWTANLLMILAASIWGAAFVAQSTAMDSMGPLGFNGARFLLSALVVAPFAWMEFKRSKQRLTRSGYIKAVQVGIVFFIAITTQQYGFYTTSVTNAGFLTALYVVLTPIMGIVIFRTMPSPLIWPIVALSMTGAYLLTGSLEAMRVGDLLMVISALFWALQIIFIGRLVTEQGNPVMIATVQFLTTGIIGAVAGLFLEPMQLSNFSGAWMEIAYTGILSGGLSFTLQAIAQRYTPPSDAAILLSSESLFAAIFGALLLGERLFPTQMLGCALIFSCILLVELLPLVQRRFGRKRANQAA
ncbi:Threonine/homoserine efflux transporter RhtA [Cohaesibacter sp. ES.047]|uniref:DMT family transporter n=1 Tax=Cohaesibacter sp. ES.047 TaxID=1798205 RepID=UPI000BBF9265|nr:DMT family transporter [Cohaesibacter sp. ES.047]SNY91528.1 Threonine/homoserine efflux transporter RhtA [Cohaesibacter sp. ES.047]